MNSETMKLVMETLINGLPKGSQDFKDRGKKAWRQVGKEVMILHENYTGKAGEFQRDKNPIHTHLNGYQLYYFPRNLFRVMHVIQNLPWISGRGVFPSRSPTKFEMLDIGAGSGAFSLGVLAAMAEGPKAARPSELSIVLVDQGKQMLQLAENNLKYFATKALPDTNLTVTTYPEGVERFLTINEPGKSFDLIGGAMMLNELNLLGSRRGTDRATRFAASFRKLGTAGTTHLFVEPGTRKGFMNLHALREQMSGDKVLFPCPHTEKCPIYSHKVNRWCHGTTKLPSQFFFDSELRQFGGLTFQMAELNYSALAVLQDPEHTRNSVFHSIPGGRIVSSWLPARNSIKQQMETETKQKIVLVCEKDGTLQERNPGRVYGNPRGQWLDPQPLTEEIGDSETPNTKEQYIKPIKRNVKRGNDWKKKR